MFTFTFFCVPRVFNQVYCSFQRARFRFHFFSDRVFVFSFIVLLLLTLFPAFLRSGLDLLFLWCLQVQLRLRAAEPLVSAISV